jgi:hypothetical protein
VWLCCSRGPPEWGGGGGNGVPRRRGARKLSGVGKRDQVAQSPHLPSHSHPDPRFGAPSEHPAAPVSGDVQDVDWRQDLRRDPLPEIAEEGSGGHTRPPASVSWIPGMMLPQMPG